MRKADIRYLFTKLYDNTPANPREVSHFSAKSTQLAEYLSPIPYPRKTHKVLFPRPQISLLFKHTNYCQRRNPQYYQRKYTYETNLKFQQFLPRCFRVTQSIPSSDSRLSTSTRVSWHAVVDSPPSLQ
ncbi:unnamed protein product, partial [Tuber aestivum]